MTRDLVGARCVGHGLGFETEPGAREREWDGQHEPDQHQDEHGAEGDGTGGAADPYEEVEEEEGAED